MKDMNQKTKNLVGIRDSVLVVVGFQIQIDSLNMSEMQS